MYVVVAALILFAASVAAWAGDVPAMQVKDILEERFNDDDLAVFIPDRLEFVCRSSPGTPWGFAFAGFETEWKGPIEIEIRGSGGYEQHDIFSMAVVTLDYGGPNGWIERSHFGLGLIQGSRNAHPPSWGVRGSGSLQMRGNLADASGEPQRITIDPAKFAPKDWDGRLWIGLAMHNVGPGKSLTARIVNASTGGKLGPERGDADLWKLVAEHQRTALEKRLADLQRVLGSELTWDSRGVPAEIRPFADSIVSSTPLCTAASNLRKAISESKDKPVSGRLFLGLMAVTSDPGSGDTPARLRERLQGLVDEWRSSGALGREIGCIIRTATNLEKIGLTDLESGRIIGRGGEPVRISAARREYEGFQIVLSPLAGCAEDVAVEVTELSGPGGAIPASNVTVNPVGYVRLFAGEPREALVPDPLLIGAVPRLKPGENQPVWVTVRVPEAVAAGEYLGSVIIRGGAGEVRIPLALKVRDFEIPRQFSLRSSFWMFRDQINRFYRLDEVSFDDYMKWIDLALEHRLCPIDVYEGRCKQLLDVIDENGEPNLSPDFTLWDRYLDRMIAGGASTVHLGQSHHFGAWFTDKDNPTSSAGQVRRVNAAVDLLREHYAKKGILDLHYLQLRDETSAPESLNVYREISEKQPDLKLLLTAPSGEARPFLDIPCPLTPGFDAGWRDEVKANGGEYWWYVCCAPSDRRFANLFIDQTAVQHRALFWQTWERKVDGLLYWGLNFWSWYGPDWAEGARYPCWRVPGEGDSSFCPLPEVPGDGFSMYPGPTPSQPLSSVRLETMRDGGEDYEYLVLLDRLISDAEKAETDSPALRRARAARAAARKLVRDVTDYERDHGPYAAVREKLADSIEELSSGRR